MNVMGITMMTLMLDMVVTLPTQEQFVEIEYEMVEVVDEYLYLPDETAEHKQLMSSIRNAQDVTEFEDMQDEIDNLTFWE